MVWIKQVGCDCPECGPDPCTEGCDCTFQANDDNASNHTDIYDVTGQFVFDQVVDIQVSSFGGGGTARFVVKADGSTIYDSGCMTNTSVSTTGNVPAGTTEITVDVTCGSPCSGFCNGAVYSVECQGS